MAIRKSTAVWKGSSREGSGTLRLGSGLFEGPYDWRSRFEKWRHNQPGRTDRRGACGLLFNGACIGSDQGGTCADPDLDQRRGADG